MLQNTNHILMVRPSNFGFNTETAENNAFQKNDTSISPAQIKQLAVEEFDAFVEKLRAAGVDVTVAQDSPEPVKPDAVFPNNWLSMHEDGTLILYPMYSIMRRNERQEAVLKTVKTTFQVERVRDLSAYEQADLFLEGTGSMIFDRVNKYVYACLSPRTDEFILDKFCNITGYQKVVFRSTDQNDEDIYHTNVMMAMGNSFVVICMDSVKDEAENAHLRDVFQKTNKTIVDISMEQMNAFAGNMLQVNDAEGNGILVMSSTAYQSLTDAQLSLLNERTKLLHSPIPTIETYGGGSARCMMAEVLLPKR